MKAALPLIDEHHLAPDFSKSHCIGIYDDEKGALEVITLGDEASTKSMAMFQILLKQNLQYIISPMCSFMSLRIFKENKLEVLKAAGTLTSDNIALLKQNKLVPFDAENIYNSGSCGSSCSSCTTSCKN